MRYNIYETALMEFNKTFEFPVYQLVNQVPSATMELRARLQDEEEKEYNEACTRVDALDALMDSLYILAGTTTVCNLKLAPVPQILPLGMGKHPLKHEVDRLCDEILAPIPCVRKAPIAANELFNKIISICVGNKFNYTGAFMAVHINNMEKLWTERPSDPTLIVKPMGTKFLVKRPDGKVLKPASHKKVDLTPFI